LEKTRENDKFPIHQFFDDRLIRLKMVMADKDSELFFEEMGDVEPLKSRDKAHLDAQKEITPGHLVRRVTAVTEKAVDDNHLTSADHVEILKSNDVLEYKQDGIQHGVYKKLRMGRYPVEARLDLHRMTVEEARREVFRFINDCMKYDLRTVIILHGKGDRNPDKKALLKSHLAKWLPDMEDVMAFHSAQKHHGGTGAVYVLLRKSENDRQANRERHGLR